MLRAWIPPLWALAGGLLAVCEFGPLSYWMNSYWGGAVSAMAGCLVFGALPRRNAWLLGLGLAIQLLTRPYEAPFLLIIAIIFISKWGRLPTCGRLPIGLLATFDRIPSPNANPKQSRNRNLDHPPLPTQPSPIRSPNDLHIRAQPNTNPRTNLRTATRLSSPNPNPRQRKPPNLPRAPDGKNPQHTLLPPTLPVRRPPRPALVLRATANSNGPSEPSHC